MSVFLTGVSLSMDAFAVSVCNGLVYSNLNKKKGITIPLTFGLFQAVMPIVGFYVSMAFHQIDAFDTYDHWIAFALLFIIGGKMVYDGIKELRAKEEELTPKKFSYPEVLLQGVATSIDALFVGFSFSALLQGIDNLVLWAWISVIIIGVTTFLISLTGLFIGIKVGKLFRKKATVAEIIGGLVLIGLGLKILIEGLL